MASEIDSKRLIRQQVKEAIAQLGDTQRRRLDSVILDAFIHSDFFSKAHSLALYSSLPDEITTQPVFEYCLHLGKRIAFPKVNLNSQSLEFYWVSSLSDLKKSVWGILEPRKELPKLNCLDEVQLVLVPGLAFDKQLGRLGRGKGFYDRALSLYKGQKVALAYSIQVLSQIPLEEWDVRLDVIFTENDVIKGG